MESVFFLKTDKTTGRSLCLVFLTPLSLMKMLPLFMKTQNGMILTRVLPAFVLIITMVAPGVVIAQVPVEVSTEKVVSGGRVYYMHEVQKNQTLYSIAKAYRVSVDDLSRENVIPPNGVPGRADAEGTRTRSGGLGHIAVASPGSAGCCCHPATSCSAAFASGDCQRRSRDRYFR